MGGTVAIEQAIKKFILQVGFFCSGDMSKNKHMCAENKHTIKNSSIIIFLTYFSGTTYARGNVKVPEHGRRASTPR